MNRPVADAVRLAMLVTILLLLPGMPGLAQEASGVHRGFFGFSYDLEDEGLRVTALVDGGPAAETDLRQGDLVRTVDGAALAGKDELQAFEILARHGPGETVRLDVARGGESLEIELTLGELPERFRQPLDRERLRRRIDEDRAIGRILALVERSPVFLVRRTTETEVHIKPKLPDAEWEPAPDALVTMLTLALGDDLENLQPGQTLQVRATPGDQRLDLDVVGGGDNRE